ncbi:MAG: hypothetical protein GY814_20875 [Gammaproteobacteria bacterium]|nr:hypothetical protein [Gammaproteobacteria bacterium]
MIKLEPLDYLEPVHSDLYMETLKMVKREIAHITGHIVDMGRGMGLPEWEIKRQILEDTLIKGLQNHLVKVIGMDMPKYIIKTPSEHGE